MKTIIKEAQLDANNNRRVMETKTIQKNETHLKSTTGKKSAFMSKTSLYILLFAGIILVGESGCTVLRDWKIKRLKKKAEYETILDSLENEKAKINWHKEKAAQLKEEGWRISGPRTLEMALLNHKKQVSTDKREFTEEVRNCKTINLCQHTALVQAQNRYALSASAHVKGKVGTVLKNHGIPDTDIDKVLAMYATRVNEEVGGILTESYTLLRESTNGAHETQVVFIIDEKKGFKLRLESFKQSLIETKLVGLELDEIDKVVNDVEETLKEPVNLK